jgi:hypothetical protein
MSDQASLLASIESNCTNCTSHSESNSIRAYVDCAHTLHTFDVDDDASPQRRRSALLTVVIESFTISQYIHLTNAFNSDSDAANVAVTVVGGFGAAINRVTDGIEALCVAVFDGLSHKLPDVTGEHSLITLGNLAPQFFP